MSEMTPIALAAVVLLAAQEKAPPAPAVQSVELVCLEHLDVGFTASPQEVARREKEHLDHAVALCKERPDFRWTVESIWQLEQWLARTPEKSARDEFVALVKEGRIEVEAGYANLHTGVMDAELVLRSFEPADAVRRELGITIDSAVQDDVPGFCALLPTAMQGSGVNYFLAGVNTSFGGGTSLGYDETPFFWEGLDGSRVLTWIARGSYVEAEKWGLGVWSKDEESEKTLESKLAELATQKYPRSRFLLMASTGDNGDPAAARSILRKVDAWNAKHASAKGPTGPKVCFTTPGRFLRELAAAADGGTTPHGDAPHETHPVFTAHRGDWSGHWEPVKANAPAAMALYRDASALLPGAEALSLRASREVGLPYPSHDLAEALHQLLLYSEHSRPGGVGWPKLTTKADVLADAQFTYDLAFGAHETLTAIVRRVTDAYAERIGADGKCVVVANPTPFENGGSVEVGTTSRSLPREVAGWTVERFGENELGDVADDPRPEPAASDGAAPKLAADALFVLPNLAHGGRVRPLDPARDGLRPLRPLDPWGSCVVELLTDRAPPRESDPVRLFERVRPLGDALRGSLRFTTAAGVECADDFLPGALPRSFVTTGAVKLVSTSSESSAEPRGDAVMVLLREPFAFQTNEAAWLGASQFHDVESLWVELLSRGVRGETRDQGEVEFLELEPTLREPLRFGLSVDHRRLTSSGLPPSRDFSDATLMRFAWLGRCPLVGRAYEPWFPSKREELGTDPLVQSNASSTVLPLQCRPTRTASSRSSTGASADDGDVLLQLQEVGGLESTEVRVLVDLEELTVARRCDLLERVAPGAPVLDAQPLAVTLHAHEVATFRLSAR
jgi:hypothetical protein